MPNTDDDTSTTAHMYKATEGSEFRCVESSTMNTDYCRAGNFVAWTEPGDVVTWTQW